MKNIIPIVLILIGFFIGWFSKPTYNDSTIPQVRIDTIYHTDTFIKPIPKKVYTLRVDTDSIFTVDSVRVHVLIPISQKTYSDSSYKAIVSGYKVSLDSMFIYKKEVVKTIPFIIKSHPKFSFGIQIGYGFGGGYAGFGGQYNFISF